MFRGRLTQSYEALAGEPWCMRPWEIARLTDHQILHLYILPAAARAEEFKNRKPAGGADQFAPGEVPSEQYMVTIMMNLGMSKKAAQEEYRKQLAMHDAKKQGGK